MIILLFTDVVRIKKYRYYPIKTLAKVYRDKERLVLAPHIYLTTGIFFVIVISSLIDIVTNTPISLSYSAHIVTITIMVSALSDAVATIVGVTKGKRHIRGGKKTWEGWIGGFVSAILLGLLSFGVLIPQYGGDILVGILMAVVSAVVFGLIDYLSPPISDNILNPLAIGLALGLLSSASFAIFNVTAKSQYTGIRPFAANSIKIWITSLSMITVTLVLISESPLYIPIDSILPLTLSVVGRSPSAYPNLVPISEVCSGI